jgi:hypothetical protein
MPLKEAVILLAPHALENLTKFAISSTRPISAKGVAVTLGVDAFLETFHLATRDGVQEEARIGHIGPDRALAANNLGGYPEAQERRRARHLPRY